uniref:Uncharacterized protein n=1 Tax=Lactuca sativa TaxID=4236 RepID=A0A9R1UYW9_LACSA|nr:hypothetical protein LSAT_V11C700372650 [Lactuca sativa]
MYQKCNFLSTFLLYLKTPTTGEGDEAILDGVGNARAKSVMKEKYRLARVMEHKMELEEKVMSRRKAELKKERLNLGARKQEEEEAHKREGLSCIGLVMLMGRNSGFTFIAMHVTLASPYVDYCLIPESRGHLAILKDMVVF